MCVCVCHRYKESFKFCKFNFLYIDGVCVIVTSAVLSVD